MALAGYGAAFAVSAPCVWRRRCGGFVQASSSSSSSSPLGDSGGLKQQHQHQQQQRLLESLAKVSNALIALSEAMVKTSSAIEELARVVKDENGGGGGGESIVAEDGSAPQDVKDRNSLGHGLAFRVQQSFLEMRLDGLGKPFEVAAKEFVTACIDAQKASIGMEELQLQLILADGALSGVFAVSTEDPVASYLMSEEARIRAAWIRYIYVTISEVGSTSNKTVIKEDPADAFVREVIKGAVEEGYTLAKLKLQQDLSGPAESPSVRTLRQANFLILLTYEILSSK